MKEDIREDEEENDHVCTCLDDPDLRSNNPGLGSDDPDKWDRDQQASPRSRTVRTDARIIRNHPDVRTTSRSSGPPSTAATHPDDPDGRPDHLDPLHLDHPGHHPNHPDNHLRVRFGPKPMYPFFPLAYINDSSTFLGLAIV